MIIVTSVQACEKLNPLELRAFYGLVQRSLSQRGFWRPGPIVDFRVGKAAKRVHGRV